MHTCRKLRNLAKQRDYLVEASDSLMYSGLLLLKKGIIKNENAINSIKHKINQLKISGFESFLESESSSKILGELLKDNKLYYTLLSHIQKKILTEIGVENQRASLLYNLSINTDLKVELIQPEISYEIRNLVQVLSAKSASLPNEIKREFSIGICDLYLSYDSETEFVYLKDGIPYDWNQFENNFNMNFVNKIIQKLTEHYQ